jgi:anti-anti-sigma regulatory factor
MFMLAAATADKAGGQFRLAALNDRVTTVLKMTRVYDTLSIHPDVDAALKSLPAV